MVTIKINNREIGQNKKTYFIAEAGLNHNGDINIAKKLVDKAFESGADAIKFQTYKSEEFLAESSEYFKFFKNVELSYDEFKEISDYARSKNITFFSAPFDIPSADFLNKIDVPCFKIASSDITNMPLIRHIAKMKKPMIISTGIGTIHEIEDAINWCFLEGNNQLILLHCVANYPALPDETNLSVINALKTKFNLPVGYSDNGESTLVDLSAVCFGANVIEKHFTIDKKLEGPDHSFSIDPDGLKNLILQIRSIEQMHGNGIKTPQQSELSNKQAIRKSITAKKDIEKDENFSQNNLSIKRPSGGIEPKYWDIVLDRKSNKFIKKDTLIHWNDVL